MCCMVWHYGRYSEYQGSSSNRAFTARSVTVCPGWGHWNQPNVTFHVRNFKQATAGAARDQLLLREVKHLVMPFSDNTEKSKHSPESKGTCLSGTDPSINHIIIFIVSQQTNHSRIFYFFCILKQLKKYISESLSIFDCENIDCCILISDHIFQKELTSSGESLWAIFSIFNTNTVLPFYVVSVSDFCILCSYAASSTLFLILSIDVAEQRVAGHPPITWLLDDHSTSWATTTLTTTTAADNFLHFILLLHTFTDETQWLPDKVQVADDSLGSSSSPDQQTMKSLSSSAVNWCGWGLTRHRCCLKVNNLKGEYRKNKGNGAVQGW